MDFGLGESLKMFERHFGKKLSKGLLLIIALTVVSFCIHAIGVCIVVPVYHGVLYIRGHDNLYDLLKDQIVNFIISLGIITSFMMISAYFLYGYYHQKVAFMAKEVGEAMKIAERMMKESEKHMENAEKNIRLGNKLMEKANKVLDIAEKTTGTK